MHLLRIACLVAVLYSVVLPRANAQLTIEIKDYVTMPITGLVDGKGSNDGLLARVNTLREEPGGANRLFITDLGRTARKIVASTLCGFKLVVERVPPVRISEEKDKKSGRNPNPKPQSVG
jgi:hypothetical protein